MRGLRQPPRFEETPLKGVMSFDLKILDGDLQIAADGDLRKVQDSEKLVQDSLKVVLTPVGTNRFFPGYGSQFSKTVVGNVLPLDFMSTLAGDQIKSSLELIQKLQRLQESSGQKVTAAELLAGVKQVKVERNQIDPRYYHVAIELLTKALTIVNTEFDIKDMRI